MLEILLRRLLKSCKIMKHITINFRTMIVENCSSRTYFCFQVAGIDQQSPPRLPFPLACCVCSITEVCIILQIPAEFLHSVRIHSHINFSHALIDCLNFKMALLFACTSLTNSL